MWAVSIGPQGQAGGGDVVVNVKTLDVTGPGGVLGAHHLAFVIQKVHHAALVIIGLDLLEALIPLQLLR